MLYWSIGTLTYFVKSTYSVDAGGFFYSENEEQDSGQDDEDQPSSRASEKEFDQRLLINKTRPEPCDQEMYLYTLVHYTERNISSSGYNKTMTDNCTRYLVIKLNMFNA